ncbi:MAG: hypothetical protein KA248_05020 [Kiritimatiellae bacterium]|nr:hypothetical protein [Kiritimatiellia bacterium]
MKSGKLLATCAISLLWPAPAPAFIFTNVGYAKVDSEDHSVFPGETVNYSFFLDPERSSDTDVTITDWRGPGTTGYSDIVSFPTATPVFLNGGSGVQWNVTVPADEPFQASYKVHVDTNAPPGQFIQNKIFFAFTNVTPAFTSRANYEVAVEAPNATRGATPHAEETEEPVATMTGEYVLPPVTDLDLGGPLPLRFTRRYASRLNDPGTDGMRTPLGSGWSSDFDAQVMRSPGSDPAEWHMHVLLPSGKRVVFIEVYNTNGQGGVWALNFDREPDPYELKTDGTDLWFLDPESERLYRFDWSAHAFAKEILDRYGNALRLQRRPDGLVTNVSDGLGRALTFDYNAASNLVRVSDGTRSAGFGHDAQGALTHATNAAGEVTVYAYDATHSFTNGNGALMTSVQYPAGNAPYVQLFNAGGQVTNQADAYGAASSFEYGAGGDTTVTDPQGVLVHRHTNMQYASRTVDQGGGTNTFTLGFDYDRPIATRNRLGQSANIGLNAARKIGTYVDPLSRVTQWRYEETVQVFTNRDQPGLAVTFVFEDLSTNRFSNLSTLDYQRDGRGLPTNLTDRASNVWSATYNERGQPVALARPGGGTQSLTYNADGTVASVADDDTGPTLFAYDALGRLTGIQRPDGSAERWGLDAMGRVTAFTNAAGGVTAFAYDANGRLATLTDPAGYAVAEQADLMDRATNRADSLGFLAADAYDDMGRLVRRREPAGTNTYAYDLRGWRTNLVRGARSWSWDYDREGQVTRAVDPLGQAMAYSYNAVGLMTQSVSAAHQTNRYVYYPDGMLALHRDAYTNLTRFRYDGEKRLIWITNALGHRAAFDRDADGNLARRTDFDGNATTFGYTPMGRLAAVTNALGEATRLAYDASGRPIRADYADGTRSERAYNAAGRPASVTDEGTNTWRFSYHPRGELLAVTNPAGGAAAFTYNLDGTLQTATDTDTGPVSNRYDAARRRTETAFPDGSSVFYEYNEHHELTARTDGRGNRTEYAYDDAGRLTRITDAKGQPTDVRYDADGRPTNLVDRTGATTTFEYDLAGRLIAVTDPTGVRTAYGYDALGRATNITVGTSTWALAYNNSGVLTGWVSPLGRMTTRVPDALQRVAQTVNALGHTNTTTYDARGRVARTTDAQGRNTDYAYDPRGLLAGVTLPDTGTVTYARDALGRVSRITDFNGAHWDFASTPMGRLQTLADPLSRVTQYARDPVGRVSGVTWPDSSTVAYTRDANGEIVRAQYSGGPDLAFQRDELGLITNAPGLALAYDAEGRVNAADFSGAVFGATYDAAGRLATVTYPALGSGAAFTVTYGYNTGPAGDGRLASVSNSLTGVTVFFGYDADGRLRTVSLPNGEVITYTWDDADRLTRLQSGDYVDLALTYDLSGRVTETDLIAPLTPSGNLVSAIANLAYDAASQISSAGYAHDARGRLTAAPGRTFAWDGASRLTNVNAATLEYTALGDVMTRTEGAAGTYFYHHHAFPLPAIVAEQNALSNQTRFYIYTPSGRLLYMVDTADGNKTYFYHFDQAGNTLALTDMDRAVTDAYAYDPYGRILARTGANPQPFAFSGAWGVRRDGTNGLYQMRARWYDATIGRFLSPEPLWPDIGSPQKLNPYQYVGNDPLRRVDRDGLDWEGLDTRLLDPLLERALETRISDLPRPPQQEFSKTVALRAPIPAELAHPWRPPLQPTNAPPQPENLECHQLPKNTAPQRPSPLEQLAYNIHGAQTPFPGAPFQPIAPDKDESPVRKSLTEYTSTDIVGGLFDFNPAHASGEFRLQLHIIEAMGRRPVPNGPLYVVQGGSPWAQPPAADPAAARRWDEELDRHFRQRGDEPLSLYEVQGGSPWGRPAPQEIGRQMIRRWERNVRRHLLRSMRHQENHLKDLRNQVAGRLFEVPLPADPALDELPADELPAVLQDVNRQLDDVLFLRSWLDL